MQYLFLDSLEGIVSPQQLRHCIWCSVVSVPAYRLALFPSNFDACLNVEKNYKTARDPNSRLLTNFRDERDNRYGRDIDEENEVVAERALHGSQMSIAQ